MTTVLFAVVFVVDLVIVVDVAVDGCRLLFLVSTLLY